MNNDELMQMFDGLSEDQVSRIKKAGEIGMAKMRDENIPFAFALFHPDILSALRGDVEEGGDSKNR